MSVSNMFYGAMKTLVDRSVTAISECITTQTTRIVNAVTGGGDDATTQSYTSGITVFNAGILLTYNYAAADLIRNVEIWTDTGGTYYDVIINKSDGSTLNFQVFTAGRWEYEGALNEAPITSISVENLGAVNTNVIINAVSRS